MRMMNTDELATKISDAVVRAMITITNPTEADRKRDRSVNIQAIIKKILDDELVIVGSHEDD